MKFTTRINAALCSLGRMVRRFVWGVKLRRLDADWVERRRMIGKRWSPLIVEYCPPVPERTGRDGWEYIPPRFGVWILERWVLIASPNDALCESAGRKGTHE